MSQQKNTGWAEVRTDTQQEITQQSQNDRIGETMLGYAELTQPTAVAPALNELENLPASWLITSLGKVIDYGYVKKAEPNEIHNETWVLELEDIEKYSSKIIQRLTFLDRQPKSTKNRFETGDVLYGKLRPYLNKVVIADSDGVCSTEIVPLSGNSFLHNLYLFYWLKHPSFLAYVTQVGYGVNMPRLGTKDGIAAPFILAPLAEQQQIAAKLDELLAQVDSIKTRLDAIPKILKRFRQSVLAAAVSGKLTEDWRADNPCSKYLANSVELTEFRGKELGMLPKNWQWLKFDQIANVASNLQDPLLTPEAFHIAPNHIESGTGKLLEYTTVSEDNVTSSKHRFYEGQILYSKIRPYLCKAAIVNFSGLCSADMYPINSNINTQYLFRWILSHQFTDWASNAESRSVLPKINQKDLSIIPVPTPPIHEQTEIVRRVEQLFAYADQIEQRVKDAQARVKHLTQSILAKAFRGELTVDWRAQNPDLICGENSAEALLAKVLAERITTSSKSTRRSKSNDK